MQNLLFKYLHQNHYFNISNVALKLQLLSHPDYPSIKSITDTLDYFQVANLAVKAPIDVLGQLNGAFLTLVRHKEDTRYALVVRKKNKLKLYFENDETRLVSLGTFENMWTGTFIVIEAALSPARQKVKYSLIISIALSVLFSAAMLADSFTTATLTLTLVHLAGLYLSYLIAKEEAGIHSNAVAKVCSTLNKSANCATVINAENGKLFGKLPLSDLSVAWFGGFSLIYASLGFNYFFMVAICLLFVPVLLFSWYQQAVVIKQWCILCLGVSSILVAQGVIAWLSLPDTAFSIAYSLKALLLLAFALMAWRIIKPLLQSHILLPRAQFELLKFKRNQGLFNTLLKTRPMQNMAMAIENAIFFGTSSPLVSLIAVTNPLCGFCLESFRVYKSLLATHGNDLRVAFIFSVPYTHNENKATQVAIRMLEIYSLEGRTAAWKAMDQWYESRDLDGWQAKHGTGDDAAFHWKETLERHKTWCDKNEIGYTPATALDGYLYPEEYKLEDLPFLIGDRIMAIKNDPMAPHASNGGPGPEDILARIGTIAQVPLK